jgi:hypothetical protein
MKLSPMNRHAENFDPILKKKKLKLKRMQNFAHGVLLCDTLLRKNTKLAT